MRRLQTIGQAVIVFALFFGGPIAAEAQVVVGVEKFEGASEKKVRSEVHKVLKKKKLKVVAAAAIEGKAAELSANMDSNDDRVRVARELGLNAFISGSVAKEGKKWVATVLVTNGSDGSVIEEKEFKHKNANRLPGVVSKGLWKALGGAINRGERPPAIIEPLPEPIAEVQAEVNAGSEPEPEPEPESSSSAFAPLELVSGVDFFTRSYNYDNDQTQTLRPYDLAGAPAATVAVNWYPMAHFQDGFASNVGLTGRFAQALGLTSETSDGGAYPTKSSAFVAGLRVRFPSDKWQASTAVVYGYHDFSIEDDGANEKPLIPSVTYSYVGIEAAGQVTVIDDMSLLANAVYKQVLSAGEVAEPRYFPNASVWGISAFAGVGYTLLKPVQARLGFDYQRYFLDLKTKAGDPLQADGANDQYLGGSLTVAYLLGGAD